MSKLVKAAIDHDPDQVRLLRQHEASTARLQAALDLERRKREQAEEELHDALRREATFQEIRGAFQSAKLPARSRGHKSPATPVICCNDWHAEACVESAVVNGLNEFNLDVAATRIARLWDRATYVIDCWRTVATIQDAVLWLGGDMISGSIHEELEESNFLGPGEAIVWTQNQIADGIKYLLKHSKLKRIHVACSIGNHGRTTKKKRVSTAHSHSYEWLMYCALAGYFRHEKRVTWQVDPGYHAYVDVQGHLVRLHHGDAIRYQGGVGGITIPVNKAVSQWNKSRPARYDIFGHWHQYLDSWSWTSCGCLVGYDAYALSIKADYQPPTQTAVFIDRERGKVLSVALHVDERRNG